MTAVDVRLKTVRMLALVICALSLGVVAVSAYLRLDAAGLGCADWPACYGNVLSADPLPLRYGVARLLHRLTASAALVLTCILVWRCLRPRPLQPAAHYALLLLMLMLGLSALGFFSADPRRALIGFLNIVGGLGLVSFSWRVVIAAAPEARQRLEIPDRGFWLRVGVCLLSGTVLLGAWLGATYSSVACLSLPLCVNEEWSAAGVWQALNPFVMLSQAAAPGNAGGITLHLLHRGLAFLTLLVLGSALWPSIKQRSVGNNARVVLVLLALVLGLGVAMVASGLNLWLVIGHGVGAAMLLAAVASLLRR